jgi:VCBS repeat-containing protein
MPFKLKADTQSVLENSTATGNVVSNDSSVIQVTQIRTSSGSNVPVAAGGVTLQGTYGFLTIMPNGSYSYTASTAQADQLARGATASDTFTYTATGSGNKGPTSATTTLKVTVTGVNDAPLLSSTASTLTTINEDQTTNAGQTVASFLQSTDVDSSALKGVAISGLSSGNGTWQYSTNNGTSWTAVGTVSETSALLLRSTDKVRFVPNALDGTTANFTYHAWDQTSGTTGTKVNSTVNGGQTAFSTGTGTASITVTPVNDAPVGVASSASGTEDGPPITGQVHATDVDSTGLTYAAVPNSAVGGSVSIDAATGDYTFTPAQDFNGAASFRFTASDGSLTSASTQVTIAIANTNDAPVAADDSGSVGQGSSVLLNVLANDSDIDGDSLSVASVGNATNGTVQIENGQVRYAPNSGYLGPDAFTYTVSDGHGGTAVGNVAVTVNEQPTNAVTVTFRQGTDGYAAAVDTIIRERYPTEGFGGAFVLSPETDLGHHTQALLSFNSLFGTGPGQIPVGATIVSATLTLQTTNTSIDAGTINPMLASWNGSSSWNSLGGGVQVGTEASSSNVVTIGATTLGLRGFDVTGSVQSWASAGTTAAAENAANHGWLFNPTNDDDWNFTSSDGDVRPVLSITYVPAGSGVPASMPSVAISAPPTSVAQMENAGKITFTVSLSQASSQDVVVTYSSADGTAKAASDYVAATGSLTFHPGETVKTFDVLLTNDGTAERIENFTAQITSATNATVATATADAHITDDDVITVPFTPFTPSLVATYNLSNGSVYEDGSGGTYGISDPSGIAWIPSLGQLFIADSEHDESPFFSTTNMFALHNDGSYIRNYSLTAFTDEPTGFGYDPNNGFLYISDDSKYGVFWVDPLNPTVKGGFFDTRHLGFLDTEDPKIDPLTGHIHILDGEARQLVELTTDGTFVDSIPLPAVLKDAEALAYDPSHDVYFVASGQNKDIWVIDTYGNVLETITTLESLSGVKPKGLELAPSSDPNDGNQLSLYVVDYGADQVNDGRLFEINLGPDWLYGP